MTFRIKNWEQYQHYKDRNPPWIKLYYELLLSRDWIMVSDSSRVLMITCLLVGSRHEGAIPNDVEYIKRAGNLKNVDFRPLVESGFLECITDASVDASVDATPRREEKRKRREEKENPSDNAIKIYDYYSTEIRKHSTSKPRALKNIDRHLKEHSPEVLWECINAYKLEIQKINTEEQYRKTCANFFGIEDQAFSGFMEEAERRVGKYERIQRAEERKDRANV